MMYLDYGYTYRQAIVWIALNDDPGSSNSMKVSSVKTLISVQLIADLFGKTHEKVARAVIRYRKKNQPV